MMPRTYDQWVENLETNENIKVEIKQPPQTEHIAPDVLKKAVEEKPDAYLRELSKHSTVRPPPFTSGLFRLVL
jgi:hypothetical protein